VTAGLAMPVASSTSTEGPRVEAFFERYLRHANDINSGEPFILEDWQRDFVHEMFRLDEQGRRIWKRVVLGIPARNGKSALAAGLVLYFLAFDEVASNPCVLVGAASGDQAGVVFNLADTYVRTNATLRRRMVVTPSRGLIRFKGNRLGRVQRVNSEAGNLYGIRLANAVLVVRGAGRRRHRRPRDLERLQPRLVANGGAPRRGSRGLPGKRARLPEVQPQPVGKRGRGASAARRLGRLP
jgi:hypothetical protein